MMKKRGMGQSWSLDIILAFVIFMLIVGILYTMLTDNKKPDIADVQLEATTISGALESSTGSNTSLAIINQGAIDPDKLTVLYEEDYLALKNKFGLKGDFCIYMIDQYGKLIVVDTADGPKNGFGNGNLSINGNPCGTIVD